MRVSRVEEARAGVCSVCIVFEGLGPGPRVGSRILDGYRRPLSMHI